MVDTIPSLAAIDYRHDEWGVDVTIAGSQKGLMLPPGLAFNAVSAKALAMQHCASCHAPTGTGPQCWMPIGRASSPTPSTNLLYGLKEAIAMLLEEGLPAVFARHTRFGAATRTAVRAWGLDTQCRVSEEHSNALTGVRLPSGFDADRFRELVLARFDMSLGQGLGRLKGEMFRVGHLGDFNDLSLMGTLSGVEMGLKAFGVPLAGSGVQAALDLLAMPPANAPGSAAS